MISAKIVADSICRSHRLTSFLLVYPRFIHSELMTHRSLARNAASSRAIPVQKMIQRIWDEPAMPVSWGKNQKGMQAGEELGENDKNQAQAIWLKAMRNAIDSAETMLNLGVHKQIANRLLEPFAHMQTLASATEWANFFNLRCHKDAQPEFQALAYEMLRAYNNSTPRELRPEQWHLPFMDQDRFADLTEEQNLKIATARAARTSYFNFDGTIAPEKDYELHDSLIASGHWSPFEHPAQAMGDERYEHTPWCGNYRGFIQYRKRFPQENRSILRPELAIYGRAEV